MTSDWLTIWRNIFPPFTSAFVHVLVSAIYYWERKQIDIFSSNKVRLTSIWIWTTPLLLVLTANTNTPSWALEELMRTRKLPRDWSSRRFAASVSFMWPANQLKTRTIWCPEGHPNQWSDLAILLFAKNADHENEKCLKIKVFLCISHSKLEKGYPFFNFHSPLRKPEKGAFFLMKSRIFLGFVFDMNWSNFLE